MSILIAYVQMILSTWTVWLKKDKHYLCNLLYDINLLIKPFSDGLYKNKLYNQLNINYPEFGKINWWGFMIFMSWALHHLIQYGTVIYHELVWMTHGCTLTFHLYFSLLPFKWIPGLFWKIKFALESWN